ncbi:BatD family protein [Alteromonas gilva]|uniref:BatD family protein n=1 Tax=Alteromonas gilva TaxID=2987522 RepID=A0ABT5L403_9ALTE|nr:BatD family protein [Alteromonas gilva]MDC8831583.1 BatD family protein [Alteromonas gilva]
MFKQRHWLWLLFISFACSFASKADVQSVTASIDKNPVMLDEAITLTVTAQGDAERNAFDSSALLSDFVVGRTSVSSQTSIVNFTSSQTTTWNTTLFPRKVGDFTIPAFTIEGQRSAPIKVKVIPVQQGEDAPARDYYVTTEVNHDSVYLQQQLRYTVKLYLASQIERGSLQSPELENAQIQQLGDDKQYTELVNGRRYQVVERNFAILPQQSGTFTISGPVFSGEVMAPNTNQRFGFFNRTKSINRVGPDLTIEVKPIPTSVDYHWLPSDFVELDQEWQSQEFVVGEPITRTLTLTAVGVVEEQLPEIEQIYPPDFKLYPDQANSATAERDNRLVVQRTESVAMIPTKAGDYIIPEVRVPWFNVKTGKTEVATLPSKTVTVAPAAGQAPAPKTPPVAAPVPAPETANQPAGADSTVVPPPAQAGFDRFHLGLLILWLVTLTGWALTWFKRKNAAPAKPAGQPLNTAQAVTAQQLINTIQSADIGTIQQSLNQWLAQFNAARRWHIRQQIKPEVDAMMASAYAANAGDWDRTGLAGKLKQLVATQKQKDGALTPLYPTT